MNNLLAQKLYVLNKHISMFKLFLAIVGVVTNNI